VLAGEDFAELANEFSIDTASASDGGELGWFPRGGLIAPLDKIVFDSEIEIVTTLVETQFGYHIVEVLGREIRRVQEEIVRQRRSETYEQWMAEVYDSSVVNTFDWWESKVPTEPTLEQYFRNQQQQ
jgi:parvulin-like peptidyl-prolyl isomerase